MAKFYDSITPEIHDFIQRQHMFFVASAPLSPEGHINLSPKGLANFAILNENRVAYLDLTGSGNETSAHMLENGRITFMFCAFEDAPRIVRLFGTGRTVLPGAADWDDLVENFTLHPGYRQIIVADIATTQTSCGYAVPLYDYQSERDTLIRWAEAKGDDGLAAYHEEKNYCSMDGLETAMGQAATTRAVGD